MTHRILLVEDDAMVGPVVKEILRKAGYEVVLKPDLPDLKMLSDYDFSAVISDFQLPSADGSAVINFIRSKVPGIPAIIMSGHGDWAVDHCENRGIMGVSYLGKPFKAKELLDTLNIIILADIMWPLLTEK